MFLHSEVLGTFGVTQQFCKPVCLPLRLLHTLQRQRFPEVDCFSSLARKGAFLLIWMLWVDALSSALMVRYYKIKAVLKASSIREYSPHALLWNLLSLIRQDVQQVTEWLSQATKETQRVLSSGTIDAMWEWDFQHACPDKLYTLRHMVYCGGMNADTATDSWEIDYIHIHTHF